MSCPPGLPLVAAALPVLATSGHCPSGTAIMSASDCSAAAKMLKLTDTSAAYDGQYRSRFDPPHCYVEGSFLGKALKYNGGSNTGNCTASEPCLCRSARARGSTPSNAPTTNSESRPVDEGYYRYGKGYWAPGWATDVTIDDYDKGTDKCGEVCDADPSCVAFAFGRMSPDSRSNHCRTYRKLPDRKNFRYCYSYSHYGYKPCWASVKRSSQPTFQGAANANECPKGTSRFTSLRTCFDAYQESNHEKVVPMNYWVRGVNVRLTNGAVYSPSLPSGCFLDVKTNAIGFNSHPTGNKNSGLAPLCERCSVRQGGKCAYSPFVESASKSFKFVPSPSCLRSNLAKDGFYSKLYSEDSPCCSCGHQGYLKLDKAAAKKKSVCVSEIAELAESGSPPHAHIHTHVHTQLCSVCILPMSHQSHLVHMSRNASIFLVCYRIELVLCRTGFLVRLAPGTRMTFS